MYLVGMKCYQCQFICVMKVNETCMKRNGSIKYKISNDFSLYVNFLHDLTLQYPINILYINPEVLGYIICDWVQCTTRILSDRRLSFDILLK